MRKDQDAYGREIYEYWKGDRTGREIVEREDGFISLASGPIEYFTEFKKWLPQTRKVIRYARGRVLDIGCGAGRHLLYMQKKGCDVVGIDNSPLAIKTCRERGLKNVHVLPVTKLGQKLGQFDTITMFCNNVGLLGSYKRGQWLLKRMHKLTSDTGRIIGESLNPYGTDLPEHLAYQRFNRKRGRMSGQLRLRVRYKRFKTEWFDYLILSPKELAELIRGTGWHIARTFGDPNGYYSCVLEKD